MAAGQPKILPAVGPESDMGPSENGAWWAMKAPQIAAFGSMTGDVFPRLGCNRAGTDTAGSSFSKSASYRGGKPAFRLNATPAAKWPLETLPNSVVVPQNVPFLAWTIPVGYAPTAAVVLNGVKV
jgi:hypothetical protein